MIKSKTCQTKTGKFLSEYEIEADAWSAAEYEGKLRNIDLVPYLCSKCSRWHLSPKNRITPSRKCSYCSGRDRKPKESYRSKADAARRAEIIHQETGQSLKMYECKRGEGWHLTKDKSWL